MTYTISAWFRRAEVVVDGLPVLVKKHAFWEQVSWDTNAQYPRFLGCVTLFPVWFLLGCVGENDISMPL